MEDALIKLDRRVARIEHILQPMGQDVAGLKSDVSGLKSDVTHLKSDVSNLGVEVSGIQRDLAGLTHTVERNHNELRDWFAQLATRFDQLTARLEARGVI